MNLFTLLIISILTSCNAQEKKANINKLGSSVNDEPDAQIGEYVTSAFEDSNGNLWFGTINKGIAKYDGKNLKYFTKKDGLPSERVTGIIEDTNGTYWLMTGEGVSKYDGENFVNFSVKDGILSNMVTHLLIDSKNRFWIGTWNGVYNFDGENFNSFSLPYPEVNTQINGDTKNWITDIKEDPLGNIWFARDGYGVCKYDGYSFTYLLKKDGLHSNNITEIEFDKDGNMWIGTRVAEKDNTNPKNRVGKGGINKIIGNDVISFPEIEGFTDGDVYGIYRDNNENIWIGTIRNGVYKFDGKVFINYAIPISIMGMVQDKKGILWLSGAGGLYRINQNGEVINVKNHGPWE